MGRLSDCEDRSSSLGHSIIVNYFFPCSQWFYLDHKPFLIEIGLLMHLLQNLYFVRSCMGVVQSDRIFD